MNKTLTLLSLSLFACGGAPPGIADTKQPSPTTTTAAPTPTPTTTGPTGPCVGAEISIAVPDGPIQWTVMSGDSLDNLFIGNATGLETYSWSTATWGSGGGIIDTTVTAIGGSDSLLAVVGIDVHEPHAPALYTSMDHGVAFSEQSITGAVPSLVAVGSQTIFGVTANAVVATTDRGATWTNHALTDIEPSAIFAPDDTHVFIGGTVAGVPTLIASSDAGATFSAGWKASSSGAVGGIWGPSPSELWAAGSLGNVGVVWHSVDGGTTFTPVTLPTGTSALNAVRGSGAVIVVSGSDGTLLESQDAAVTSWISLSPPYAPAGTVPSLWVDSTLRVWTLAIPASQPGDAFLTEYPVAEAGGSLCD